MDDVAEEQPVAGEGNDRTVSFRFGGSDAKPMQLVDHSDLVVVRSQARGVTPDIAALSQGAQVEAELEPLFEFPATGVGVFATPPESSPEVAEAIHPDPDVEFAGRGLRDEFGAPVLYTENLFVKFADDLDATTCEDALATLDLTVKRPLPYAGNAYFAAAPQGSGRGVFTDAERLLERDDVELCHPELVREIGWNRAFSQQWHLAETEVDGTTITAHAGVEAAWELSEGEGITIAVIDDGVDVSHPEFATPGKVVSPQSLTAPREGSAHPQHRDENHGTACAGVACAAGVDGASGVAPKARLMPLRFVSGLGSADEADAFAWAAEHGADVISCSWGPEDGTWDVPNDPRHDQVVPLPDMTRLAIDFALSQGRDGKGCTIVWAAGNGNEDVGNDGYASYEGVIAVAACSDRSVKSAYSDYGDAIWCSFPSNYGTPSLTPGIWTTDRPGGDGYNHGDPGDGDAAGNYISKFGGTSSACPGVAGVVALMLARNPALGPHEVRELLRATCEKIDVGDGRYDANGRSPFYGYGRVNARAAVDAAA